MAAKQRNVPEQHKGEFGWGDVWTWVAIDQDTRLIVTWLVGTRDDWAARDFISDLGSWLANRMQITTLLAAGAALVACSGPAPVARGAAAPYIDAARTSLENNHEGPMTPMFTFHSARCREDGGLVLLFEQRGGLGSEGFAFALARTPSADAGVWAGGFAPTDADSDPEIVVFFAEASEVACK